MKRNMAVAELGAHMISKNTARAPKTKSPSKIKKSLSEEIKARKLKIVRLEKLLIEHTLMPALVDETVFSSWVDRVLKELPSLSTVRHETLIRKLAEAHSRHITLNIIAKQNLTEYKKIMGHT